MSYAIFRSQPINTLNDLSQIGSHNKRDKQSYASNPDINKELSINNIFREMYGLGLIKNFENWANYREKRNYTSHEYNIALTYSIIDVIPNFIEDTEYLIENLE